MRVISGSARHLVLKTIEGMDTRPTTDRIKETLFNMLQPYIYDCSFLDLFSGSGAIGIEALSRGGKYAVFVESSDTALDCIRHNLQTTHLEDKARIIAGNVFEKINSADLGDKVFDIVFMDPPYEHEYEKKVLLLLSESGIINKNTLIIVEASKKTMLDYLDDIGYELIKEKIYKTNKHVFIRKKQM